ncbi:MAG: class II aldolase/adducin family protein [Planctomycetes bacterium]|nr:class II aldolase/adducin family protein [Planctomycetota bacterium]
MQNMFDKDILTFVKACHKAGGEYGLMKCSSGNMSWRIDEEHMLVTASRSWMAEIGAEQVAVCSVETGDSLNGVVPSTESRFHSGILKNRPEQKVVLHFQSPAATVFACTDCTKTNFNIIPEIGFYIGEISIIEYVKPATAELAVRVIEEMKKTAVNMAVLRNHGMVTVGASLDEAIQRAVFFELACGTLLKAGDKGVLISDENVNSLRSGGYGDKKK